jgi:hypothetical protein
MDAVRCAVSIQKELHKKFSNFDGSNKQLNLSKSMKVIDRKGATGA